MPPSEPEANLSLPYDDGNFSDSYFVTNSTDDGGTFANVSLVCIGESRVFMFFLKSSSHIMLIELFFGTISARTLVVISWSIITSWHERWFTYNLLMLLISTVLISIQVFLWNLSVLCLHHQMSGLDDRVHQPLWRFYPKFTSAVIRAEVRRRVVLSVERMIVYIRTCPLWAGCTDGCTKVHLLKGWDEQKESQLDHFRGKTSILMAIYLVWVVSFRSYIFHSSVGRSMWCE